MGITAPGPWAYCQELSLQPGQALALSVSSPAAYCASLVTLSDRAVLDQNCTTQDDRDQVQLLQTAEHGSGQVQTIEAGSYIAVGGAPLRIGEADHGLTFGAWLRLWAPPEDYDLPWNWANVLGQFDYPTSCTFTLLVDHARRAGVYLGDGEAFRYQWLHLTDAAACPIGIWVHLAVILTRREVTLCVDGEQALTAPIDPRPPAVEQPPRLKIGAAAEGGAASGFLDADLAQPFIGPFAGSLKEVQAVVDDRARSPLTSTLDRHLWGYWPLSEEQGTRVRDASGSGRHGTLMNGATWQIGGPSCDPSNGEPGYEPALDPDRGHAIRLSRDDLPDCGWPVTDQFDVPEDLPSGIYAALVRLDGAAQEEELAMPFVVGRRKASHANSIALLVPTFTWLAYGRVPTFAVRVPGLTSSFYSTHENGRPFYRVGMRGPLPNLNPFSPSRRRARFSNHSHLVRPERICLAWLRREGYTVECISDHDLHREPACLRDFAALVICGHSEYWSDEMRAGLADFLIADGKVLNLSGNTMYWRVSVEDQPPVLEGRKATYAWENDSWLPPERWAERWHTDGKAGGRWQMLGEPGRELLGLDTQGWTDDGSPASFSAYRVLDPDHFLFGEPEPVEISPQGLLASSGINGPAGSGYEVDATPPSIGIGRELPEGMVVLARAEQRMAETIGVDPDLGAELIYWRRAGGGTVVNVGSIAFSGTLPVDQGSQAFVRNVLFHFGLAASADNDA